MIHLRKHLLIGFAALGIAASGAVGTLALAQSAAPSSGEMQHKHEQQSPEKMAEHTARRDAALHDALKLTPQQESAWTTYTAKMRAGQPMQRPDHEQMEKMAAPERMEKMLAMMRDGERRMADRLEATKPFYAVLTPAQRALFDKQTSGKHHHGEHGGWMGHHHDDK
jgi:protein CpxP